MAEPRLLTIDETAEELRVGRTKIFELMREGKLEFVPIGRRGRRIPPDAVDAYISHNRQLGGAA